MLRLLVTPRWLAATLITVLAVVTCVGLGAWQWDRAHRPPRPVPIEDERVVPLADVLASNPDVSFPSGLLVRGTGAYDGAARVVVGTDPAVRWSTVPLAVDADAGSVLVVRGRAKPAPSAPASSAVVVTGRLQPAAATGDLSAAALRSAGADPRGYLVVTDQQPPDARPAVLVASPVPLRSSGLRWQNSVYAVQWWLFALFFVVAWVRFFREDLRARDEELDAAAAALRPVD